MYESRDLLVATSLKHKGDWDKIYKSLTQHEKIEKHYIDEAQNLKCSVVTLLDEFYPSQLKGIYKPPFVLYYYGNLSLVSNYYNCVSMVGSRNYSAYGEKMTRLIASGLAQAGYVIVSGMAIGIDTIAQNEAIENGGGTVAVLGSGIDYCYPARNKKLYEHLKNYHLVISEYPGDIVPESRFFPIRNRIIAGISKTLVITEAEPLSGTSTTAALALNGNADVMCVPYLAGSHSECNRLIAAGATLVEEAEDVINNMSRY